ncbi:hypothetical protein VH571_15635 [Frondihabitans sp. 4ASC-45]|uniref:hypothetical protein n=1 Tax=Frondihabitans sp. 4ASC-45 TaxID=3111636 RepID=UPI003C2871A0
MTKGTGQTAAEIMAELEANLQFVAEAKEPELERFRQRAVWADAEKDIVSELRNIGYDIESVWDLVPRAEPYPEALPVLLWHLEHGDYPARIDEGLARAMAVPDSLFAWKDLVALYSASKTRDRRDGLAAALAAIATATEVHDLIQLADEPRNGESRVLFLRPILTLGGQDARATVERYVEDEELAREARALLKKSIAKKRAR